MKGLDHGALVIHRCLLALPTTNLPGHEHTQKDSALYIWMVSPCLNLNSNNSFLYLF